ncbi:hypothetical protein DNTS_017653 [Danionella cerebrum]|uniref:Uncharacterized protein n=1 Tax=Danionella cerebrum TaxID=2873325 RepID=A0A553MXC8_9TELE|nr:hypothetical protein DNTS_017653 [Danionella translucida]
MNSRVQFTFDRPQRPWSFVDEMCAVPVPAHELREKAHTRSGLASLLTLRLVETGLQKFMEGLSELMIQADNGSSPDLKRFNSCQTQTFFTNPVTDVTCRLAEVTGDLIICAALLSRLAHVQEAVAVFSGQFKLRGQREHGLVEVPQHCLHGAGILMAVVNVVIQADELPVTALQRQLMDACCQRADLTVRQHSRVIRVDLIEHFRHIELLHGAHQEVEIGKGKLHVLGMTHAFLHDESVDHVGHVCWHFTGSEAKLSIKQSFTEKFLQFNQ